LPERVTLKHVAEHAGVSFKTVARVITSERGVREENRRKVIASIKALGYEVDPVARGMRSTHTYTLALVVDGLHADVQSGVLRACEANDYSLQIMPCELYAGDQTENLIRSAQRSKLSGLVLTPPLSEHAGFRRALAKNNVPFAAIVSADKRPAVDYPCAHIDDHRAAYDLTQHLIQFGHRGIGFIWGDESHRSSNERYRGYREALEEHEIKVDRRHVEIGEYSFESGRRCATRLLQRDAGLTAIMASNDEIAAGAMLAARIAGKEIPADISITGFEDSLYSSCSWPQITTARQPTEQIAYKITQILIQRIRGAIDPKSGELCLGFKPELVVKGSTGPAKT